MLRSLTNLHRRTAFAVRPARRTIVTSDKRINGLFEEEHLPEYNRDQFYPVHIGEVFQTKYKVVGKLGYGASSTAWLCRNLSDSTFVTVKVCTHDTRKSEKADQELHFYEHVSSLRSQHPGQLYIRGLLDHFTITGPTGEHLCLVQPPMHMTIRELQFQNPTRLLNHQLLKLTLFNLLQALSFLHDEAGVVHTDINPSNIMLTIPDQSLLTSFEQDEAKQPSPTKVIDETLTIYGSRKFGLPKGSLWGQPMLCDFGAARVGLRHRGLIQPEVYRAPEVLFDMGWTTSVDIWNVAVFIWDLFEQDHLFDTLDENEKSNATIHIAEMIAYMGLPPLDYLKRSSVTSNVFDEQGAWKAAGNTVVPNKSLEDVEDRLKGEAQRDFLEFVGSMLRWLPEERKSATELLKDPFLYDETLDQIRKRTMALPMVSSA